MKITLICLPTVRGIVPKYGQFIETRYQNMESTLLHPKKALSCYHITKVCDMTLKALIMNPLD